jgi:hypothetical protein
MASFIALYRGETIGAARLIATTADPDLVCDFVERLLSAYNAEEKDSVLRELQHGRQRALRLVRSETSK